MHRTQAQLTIQERGLLLDALLSGFPSRDELSILVSIGLNIASIDQITTAETQGAMLVALVGWAEANGYLQTLVHAVHHQRPNNPRVRAFMRDLWPQISARQSSSVLSPADPFDACLLRAERPFINRKTLRTHMRELAGGSGSRVLAIDGPPACGKSYSLQYIAFIAEHIPSLRVAAINLKQESSYAIHPESLIKALALQMSCSMSAIPQFDPLVPRPQRWLNELVDWMVGEVSARRENWCFVLDGFSHDDVPDDTRTVIRHLMLRAETAVSRLRVVLLTYTVDLLPPDIEDFIRTEHVGAITKKDVREHFRRLADSGLISATGRAVDAIVDAVWQRATQAGGARLAPIVAEATRLLRE